jgi:hypothetical protein
VESLLDGAHVARKVNNVVNVGGDGLMEMYPEKMGILDRKFKIQTTEKVRARTLGERVAKAH